MAAGFGLLLFGAFYWLVAQRLNLWAALLAVFFLLAAPGILLLSISVMLEVPAFALALLSACILFKWCKNPGPRWLLASGIIMGVALQTKLTAVLIIPAMLVEIALTRFTDRKSFRWKATAFDIFQWASAAALASTLIGLSEAIQYRSLDRQLWT